MPYSTNPDTYPEIYSTLFEQALVRAEPIIIQHPNDRAAKAQRLRLLSFIRALLSSSSSKNNELHVETGLRYKNLSITVIGTSVIVQPMHRTSEYEAIIAALSAPPEQPAPPDNTPIPSPGGPSPHSIEIETSLDDILGPRVPILDIK